MPSTPAKETSIVRRMLFAAKFVEIRLRFVAILVITAVTVGYWDTIQNYYERWQRTHHAEQAPATEGAQAETEFFCAMHPFVVRDHAGKCPICGMDLVERKKGAPQELPPGTLARVQIAPDRVMQAGIQTEPVLYRMLTATIRSYGIAEVAEDRVAEIVARFPGRVQELMVNAVGLVVKKGEPLARIYSPKYLAASEEFIRALGTQRKTEGAEAQASPEDKKRADLLADAARRRLILAGFTGEQLDAVAREGKVSDTVTLYAPLAGTVIQKGVVLGQTVEEGSAIYTVADLSTLWAQVRVAEADIAGVGLGMPVEITAVAWPGEIFYGNVELVYPTVEWENRTIKVRVAVANPAGKLRPGMYLDAVIRSPIGQFEEEAAPAAKAGEEAKASIKAELPTRKIEEATAYLGTLGAGAEYYGCSMDPEVVSDRPGECPLCGMKLEKETKGEGGAVAGQAPMSAPVGAPSVPAAEASTEQWAEGYACAMHPDELSDTPGLCRTCNCGMQMKKWRVERVLAIPEGAVIDTGNQKVVYFEVAPGVYDARAISLGQRTGAYYPVLSGLSLNDRIVSRGSFLIDAEARLNPIAAATKEAGPGEPPSHAGQPSGGNAP